MAPSAKVKVLHRATEDLSRDSSSPKSSASADGDLEQQLRRLQAVNESLKQRLEQSKATAATERKRLADELRLERAGRERAEELLVKQSKELESTIAAKGRLEEAFSRSMAELRYTRLEHTQAEETIQQLLRELMLLREIVTRVSSIQSNSGKTAEAVTNGNSCHENSNSSCIGTAMRTATAASPLPPSSQAISNKRISRSKLLGELHQLRTAKAAAESKHDDLLQRLGALEAEKERAEECQEMISRQTAKLLDDKRQLLNDLGTKDEAVRGLEAGLDHLHHQLELALQDRHLLLKQLSKVADEAEMEALQRAMEEGTYTSPATQRKVSLAEQDDRQHEEQGYFGMTEQQQPIGAASNTDCRNAAAPLRVSCG